MFELRQFLQSRVGYLRFVKLDFGPFLRANMFKLVSTKTSFFAGIGGLPNYLFPRARKLAWPVYPRPLVVCWNRSRLLSRNVSSPELRSWHLRPFSLPVAAR